MMNIIQTFFNKENKTGKKYIALPNQQTPRVFIPLNSKTAFIKGFQVHNTASPLNRMLRKLLTSLYIFLPLMKSRIVYSTAAFEQLLENFRTILPEVAFDSVSVYVGTADSANQKLTIQLMDRENTIIGFIKLTDDDGASQYIENEYKALECFSSYDISGLDFPQSQNLFQVRDNTCLYQENIFESGTPCGYVIDERIYKAVMVIAQPTVDWEKLDAFYVSKTEQYSALPLDNGIGQSLLQAIDLLAANHVPSVSVHGDFVPYNIKLKSNGIALIDWEFYQERCFPLYDLFTFVYQGGVQILNKQPAALLQDIQDPHSANGKYIQQYLKELAIDTVLLKPLLLLCLAEGLRMYLSLRSDADPVNNHFTAGMSVLNNVD